MFNDCDSSSTQGIVISPPIETCKKSMFRNGPNAEEILGSFDFPEKTAMLRFELYKKELERVENQVEKLEEYWHGGFIREVVEFVKSTSPTLFQGEAEIPLGFLRTGLSPDENCRLFKKILLSIQSQGNTHLVTRLSSKQCPNVKAGFENIFKQLVERDEAACTYTEELEATFDEMNLSKTRNEKSMNRGNRYSSIYDLRKWYMDLFPDFKTEYDQDFIGMETPLIKFETSSLPTTEKSESKYGKSSNSSDDYCCTSAKKPRLNVSESSRMSTGSGYVSTGQCDSSYSSSEMLWEEFARSEENEYFTETESKIFAKTSLLERFPNAEHHKQKPIVVMIEAADFYQRRVLQDLLQLLSCSKLPIILLIGVTCGIDNLEHIVPAGSTFHYKVFNTVDARQRVADFMDKVVFSLGTPLRLSGSIVKYMSSIFLDHSFSTKRIKQAYHICLLQYYRSPKSVLSSRSDAQNIGDSLSMTLSTVKSYKGCKNRSKSPKKKSSEPDNNTVQHMLEKYRVSLVSFFAALHFFSEFADDLPNSPFGKNLVDLYSLAWDGDILNPGDENDTRSLLQQFVSLVQQFSSEEISRRLNRGMNVLDKFHADNMNFKDWTDTSIVFDLIKTTKEFQRRLRDASEEQKKIDQEPKKVLSPRKVNSTRKNLTALELKELNKKGIETFKKKRATVFQILQEEIVDYLTKLAITHFKPVSTIPFSEIFVYDDLDYLKSHISVNIQESVHKTLHSPGLHIQDKCSSETRLSISILYNLVSEGVMKTVNLNTLYQQFKCQSSDEISQYQPATSTSRRASVRRKCSITEDELLIRFRQSVAELQILGLIKPSMSNPDEFLRLGWAFANGS